MQILQSYIKKTKDILSSENFEKEKVMDDYEKHELADLVLPQVLFEVCLLSSHFKILELSSTVHMKNFTKFSFLVLV